MLNAAWETITGGAVAVDAEEQAGLVRRWTRSATHEQPKRDYVPARRCRRAIAWHGVYFAATEHDEDQPVHLRVHDTSICIDALRGRVRQPLHALLPRQRLRDRRRPDADGGTGKRLQINAANCVHCKTCDIKDPYEIITWVTPEGGSGPNYQNL